VALLLVERDLLVEVPHLSIDTDTDEACAPGFFEDARVLALLRASYGGQQQQP
jgi:hypothetical protein